MKNIIHHQGIADYYEKIFSEENSERYYVKLLNDIHWRHDEVKMFGKIIHTRRKVAWFGDEAYSYQYSGKNKIAENWPEFIFPIKDTVEEISGIPFNSCLLNLYHSGTEGMSWHSDDEKMLEENATIASVSFGAERKFGFRNKQSQEIISLILENGSLLIMKDEIQKYWQHQLYISKKITQPRINLTFRRIKTDE